MHGRVIPRKKMTRQDGAGGKVERMVLYCKVITRASILDSMKLDSKV